MRYLIKKCKWVQESQREHVRQSVVRYLKYLTCTKLSVLNTVDFSNTLFISSCPMVHTTVALASYYNWTWLQFGTAYGGVRMIDKSWCDILIPNVIQKISYCLLFVMCPAHTIKDKRRSLHTLKIKQKQWSIDRTCRWLHGYANSPTYSMYSSTKCLRDIEVNFLKYQGTKFENCAFHERTNPVSRRKEKFPFSGDALYMLYTIIHYPKIVHPVTSDSMFSPSIMVTDAKERSPYLTSCTLSVTFFIHQFKSKSNNL